MPSLQSPSLTLIHRLRPCLLLLCSLSSLTASVVTHLPGYEGPLPFHLETGYVSVDEERGAELFYYFVRSEGKPEDDPLLWLSRGPGCSSFSALAFEVGPVTFTIKKYDENLPKLEQRPYAWTKIANIIFVDSPVGTGFSFIENPGVAYDVGERTSISYLYDFLIKWLIDRPQFLACPLYIVGESHAGKIPPLLN